MKGVWGKVGYDMGGGTRRHMSIQICLSPDFYTINSVNNFVSVGANATFRDLVRLLL